MEYGAYRGRLAAGCGNAAGGLLLAGEKRTGCHSIVGAHRKWLNDDLAEETSTAGQTVRTAADRAKSNEVQPSTRRLSNAGSP
ncbi:MAG: hypothetical protein ACLSA6_10920 [Holdemania massiliensis]